MATQLTLVNNVLRRLREDTVTSVADNAYAQLIAMFINDGMAEVQEAYDWSALVHDIDVDLVQGTASYDLSATVAQGGNVDNSGSPTTMDSMLRFDAYGRPLAYIYDDSSDPEPNIILALITYDEYKRKQQLDRDEQQLDPCAFALKQADDGDGYYIYIWPTPDASRRLRITFWTPQAELSIDGTDDATDIVVPNPPVEAYAHMTAANERGEEIGEPGNLLERRWQRRLGGESAISADQRADRYESVRS